MKTEKEIGIIIRELRGSMSLREFAKKCDTSHTTIDNLEKGYDFRTGKPTQVKMATLQKIADACNVPISYIIGGDESASQIEELKIALFGGDSEVTEEMWAEVLKYVQYLKSQQKIGSKEK